MVIDPIAHMFPLRPPYRWHGPHRECVGHSAVHSCQSLEKDHINHHIETPFVSFPRESDLDKSGQIIDYTGVVRSNLVISVVKSQLLRS